MGNGNDEDFKPREYQVEMLETAIKQNTIIFMPTGSGKTYIAAMLIKHMAKEVEKPFSKGGKRTFFLVNTVALVSQQADSIKKMLPLTISMYSGDMGVDYWDHNRWSKELETNQVLVMTAQIFLNLLSHNYIVMNRVNLLIMDECHHTMNNHSMNQIMKIYHEVSDTRPRILGLTATLLNANCKLERVGSEIKTLETNLDSKVVTASDEELVDRFSTNPNEKIIYYSSKNSLIGSDLLQSCVAYLKKAVECIHFNEEESISPIDGAELISDSKKTVKKKLLNVLEELNYTFNHMGLYAAVECALAVVIRLERVKLSTTDDILPNLLNIITTKLHHFRNMAFKLMRANVSSESMIPLIYSTDKLKKLIDCFVDYDPNRITIIFVERRLTAKVLYYILSKLSEINNNFKNVRPDYIVGFNSNPFNDTREVLYSKKSNLLTLKKFNNNESNVLVASNVIEEGIDICICNSVVKFDLPQTFRSYIQSKGRARNRSSTFVLLMPADDPKESKNYKLFKTIEDYMRSNLHGGKAMDYLQDVDAAENGDKEEDIPPYYPNGVNGPVLTGISAISLINRYCVSLPQDKFCPLTAVWWVKKTSVEGVQKFQGILQLPLNSPIKYIITGPLSDTRLNAKRSVSLKACKLLYECGELNDNLLPCGKYSKILDDKTLFPHWKALDSKTAGTRKMKRPYDKHFSDWAYGCRPKPDINLYIHLIRIQPNYERPAESRLAAFYDILKSEQTFSILSSKKWPKLCQFSMFMNVGEMKIDILENVKTVKLSKKDINLLFSFHCLLFTEILPIKKKFIMRDYENYENSFFIIPTIEGNNGDVSIDWKTIKKHKGLPAIEPIDFDDRSHLVVNDKTYLGKVVIPWYRPAGETTRYIVTKVCEDEFPDSPFPSVNFDSYTQYFKQRYNQTIFDLKQPLIQVRAISSRRNCLLPRGQRKNSRRKRLAEEDDFEETLIPELCYLLEFPAVYMLKITVIPSIIHRLHYLLIAEELRQKIAQETKLGPVKISSDFCWQPLRVDNAALKFDDKTQAHSTIEVSDMLTSNMNALKEGIYPWKEEDEPFNIERYLFKVDLLAIIHYQQFMSDKIVKVQDTIICENTSPKKSNRFIAPPKAPLNLLDKDDIKIGPELHAVLQALTAATAADIINYERLETLGDSFLKFIVSLALFVYYPHKDEGKLTQIKGKIIGNKNFFFIGSNINLGSRLKVNDFSPDDWDVPCFCLSRDFTNIIKTMNISPNIMYQICLSALERDSGLLKEETRLKLHDLIRSQEADETYHSSWSIIRQHSVPDKIISDAVEALIGVYLQACGIKGALIMCQWLGILAHKISDTHELLISPAPTAVLNPGRNIDQFLVEPERLEATIGYKFKDRSFLLQALTHSTFSTGITDCYQRLEFLGDAILDFLITAHIYENCGDLSPGDLTDLRSALVNNVTFACLSVRHGFHKYLNARASKLSDIILRFVGHQEKRNHKIGAEVLFLIEEQNAQVAESVDVPKVLGDLFESLAAAIYLDSGKSLQKVWNVYFNLMKKEINEFSKNVPKNHIRLLYEKFPSPAPKFGEATVMEDKGILIPLEVYHNTKSFLFHGIGDNKYHAKLAAAKMALRAFHEKYADV